MPITIKEVYVKTTVERNLNHRETDDMFMKKVANEIYQMLKYESLKDIRKKKER